MSEQSETENQQAIPWVSILYSARHIKQSGWQGQRWLALREDLKARETEIKELAIIQMIRSVLPAKLLTIKKRG